MTMMTNSTATLPDKKAGPPCLMIATLGDLQKTLESLGWTREPLPSSRDVHACCHVGSNGSNAVETEDMLQFVLENGVPNVQRIQCKEEQRQLKQAIKFCKVPMLDFHLASQEVALSLLKDDKAIGEMLQVIGFQATNSLAFGQDHLAVSQCLQRIGHCASLMFVQLGRSWCIHLNECGSHESPLSHAKQLVSRATLGIKALGCLVARASANLQTATKKAALLEQH